MTARRVSRAEFDRLIIANPEAVIEFDNAARRAYIKTATRKTYWTPIAASETAVTA